MVYYQGTRRWAVLSGLLLYGCVGNTRGDPLRINLLRHWAVPVLSPAPVHGTGTVADGILPATLVPPVTSRRFLGERHWPHPWNCGHLTHPTLPGTKCGWTGYWSTSKRSDQTRNDRALASKTTLRI